ncbi:MAG TPA: RNA pyrophosphohydrolase [Hyphomicrobiaceae bacterium]|nr:RNA pyrophosphohydrolase [Hyphomicrobiaceae bacterium]
MPRVDDIPEGYRPCVGVMILNRAGLVWVGHRADDGFKLRDQENWWQMPQGGIDAGETPRAAAMRELHEETGIASGTIIAETDGWLRYDLPPELVGHAWKGRWKGQAQRWFAIRFTGADSEIDIAAKPGHTAEFDSWRWVPMADLVGLIVPFKRDVYREVVSAFSHLAGTMA